MKLNYPRSATLSRKVLSNFQFVTTGKIYLGCHLIPLTDRLGPPDGRTDGGLAWENCFTQKSSAFLRFEPTLATNSSAVAVSQLNLPCRRRPVQLLDCVRTFNSSLTAPPTCILSLSQPSAGALKRSVREKVHSPRSVLHQKAGRSCPTLLQCKARAPRQALICCLTNDSVRLVWRKML